MYICKYIFNIFYNYFTKLFEYDINDDDIYNDDIYNDDIYLENVIEILCN